MALALSIGSIPAGSNRRSFHRFRVSADGEFPAFLPKQVENIKDPFARKLAARIDRLPVDVSGTQVMSSCVKPLVLGKTSPVVLLHGFDSSCLEWRYSYPLLEEAGLEAWAVDILGWGFSDLERRPPCNVASKREHLYQMWNSFIKKPMILVGPSLGAAVAIDFAVTHPEAVEKLVLVDASVYAEGTGEMSNLPRALAYAGVAVLKSFPLRFYANVLAFNDLPFDTSIDWINIGCLHCRYPWWEDTTVDFMLSGGYNVTTQIEQDTKYGSSSPLLATGGDLHIMKVKQRTLIIWGQDDKIIDSKLAVRLHCELPDAILRQIPDCGHIPHVENPSAVAKLITEFVQ